MVNARRFLEWRRSSFAAREGLVFTRFFGATTRVGRPLGMTNFSETARGPAFAVAAGLAVYPQFAGREHFEPRRRHARGEANYVTRVGRWLRESF